MFLLSGWDILLIDLLIINFLFYLLRQPVQALINNLFKKRIVNIVLSAIYNLIWVVFIFWVLILISIDFFIAIISFLIVAISLNFRKIINNVSSGAVILAQKKFDLGDLIETNNIQGFVEEINLNYTRLREFDGVKTIIPNSIIFTSSIKRFSRRTHRIQTFEDKNKDLIEYDSRYQKYIKQFKKIIERPYRITNYVKDLEVLGSVSPEILDEKLNSVFEKYTPIFGQRPTYVVDTITFGRTRILLYVRSNDPQKVLNFLDAFQRDLAYSLYQDLIYKGWDKYKKNKLNITNPLK